MKEDFSQPPVPGEEYDNSEVKNKYKREDYTKKIWVQKLIIKEFDLFPEVDLFADSCNARCSEYFDAAADSLLQDWPEGKVLWCNPPWTLWPKAAAQIVLRVCTVICILPGWSCDWVKVLLNLSLKRIYFETGVKFFEIAGKPCPGIKWPVWALLVKSTGKFDENLLDEPVIGLEKCRVVPVWASTSTQRRRKRRFQVKKFWNEQKSPNPSEQKSGAGGLQS